MSAGVDALLNGAVAGLHGPVLHPMNSLLLLLLVQELKHLLAARLPIFTTLFLFSAVFGDEDGRGLQKMERKEEQCYKPSRHQEERNARFMDHSKLCLKTSNDVFLRD